MPYAEASTSKRRNISSKAEVCPIVWMLAEHGKITTKDFREGKKEEKSSSSSRRRRRENLSLACSGCNKPQGNDSRKRKGKERGNE